MTDTKLTRIAALLRKAESTDNEHEAAAFMEAAQRLATLESVDLAVARAHTASTEKRSAPIQRTITVGERGKRGLATYVRLFLTIGKANDVTCDIANNSTYVIAYGFETDIDATEALYASLLVQMVRASDAYLKSDERKAETVARWNKTGRQFQIQPINGTVARNNFMAGFAARIGLRLTEARDAARQSVSIEEDDAPESMSASVELVLRDKDLEVLNYYRAATKAKGSWRGTRGQQRSSGSVQAGSRAGASARLGGEKAIGGSRVAIAS